MKKIIVFASVLLAACGHTRIPNPKCEFPAAPPVLFEDTGKLKPIS